MFCQKLIFTCLICGAFVVGIAATTINQQINPPNDNVTSTKKLNIAIYYEALCPDSMDFMTNQFAPVYDRIKTFIDVAFVPFGKSESEKNGENFYCQHGPAECTGNRLQSCVLDALADDDQDAKVRFVTCQMKWNAEYTGQKCANLVNVSYADVTECSTGSKGVELQLNAEKKTHTVARPYPSFIPTIVYNEKYNRQNQWRSLRDFKKLVCEKLVSTFETSNELSQACA